MKRVAKAIIESIFGLLFIMALLAIFLLMNTLQIDPTDPTVDLLMLALLTLLVASAIGMVTYSRTGWTIDGYSGEWADLLLFIPFLYPQYRKNETYWKDDESQESDEEEFQNSHYWKGKKR